MKPCSDQPVIAIPIFSDNYVWLYPDNNHGVIVVDPGDARPIIKYCTEHQQQPSAIFITHTHYDHINGVAGLVNHFGAPVYGPTSIKKIFPSAHPLDDGETVTIGNASFEILLTPGHTLDHIAYYNPQTQSLFCGDTLFSSGCGYLFEGTPKQMHQSLSKFATLPDNTACYCTHEYTLANLNFARTVEPENADIQEKHDRCKMLLNTKNNTLPTTIGAELATNPFLRCHHDSVKIAAERFADKNLPTPVDVFATLRFWKNTF